MIHSKDDYYVDCEEIVLAHRFTFEKDDFCDYSGGRRFCGLMYAVSGSATYVLSSGEKYTVSQGEVAFIPKRLAYIIRPKDRYEHFTVNFTVNKKKCQSDAVLSLLSAEKMVCIKPRDVQVYKTLFSRIAEIWQKKETGYRMSAVSLLYSLLDSFISENYVHGIDSVSYQKVLPAKLYLDENYKKNISIDTLANLTDMSPTNFRRLFLAVFGKSAMAYKNNLLLLHACDLLSDNVYTIREVAERCGFADANYFSRFFKKHMGITPKEYKSQYFYK